MVPNVYSSPPATKNVMLAVLSDRYRGFIANITIHPIRIYISVDNLLNLWMKKALNIIPAIAIPHTIPNKVQPNLPCKAIRVSGV